MAASACGTASDAPTTTTTGPATSTTQPDSTTTTTESGGEPADFEVIAADLPRQIVDIDPADMRAVTAGDFLLGLDLFREAAGNDNYMVSPYSVAMALSMLYGGARSTTADEIAAVMHITVDDEVFHEVRNALDASLAASSSDEEPSQTEARPFTIRPANSVWGQIDFPFEAAYLSLLAEQYGAGLRGLDFMADPDAARRAINGWVEDVTEDRIQDLLPGGSIDSSVVMVLVNAIWFYGSWADSFEEDQTGPGSFELLDGTEVQVDFMHNNAVDMWWQDADDYRAVRLPFEGDAAMVIVVPEGQSPLEFAERLDPSQFELGEGDTGNWRFGRVTVSMPKFEFTGRTPLKDVLFALGMTESFTPSADFTGIAQGIFVDDAFHKTFIAVDEFGAEAAAATALSMRLSGSIDPPPVLVIDQPFLFWIEHEPTGEVLFLGQVTDPR